ncbi:MAG: signal peptide peptidase SppA [Clostridiales Family XIII bacterium]|jgi:protease-4|nr:signal peptide peptidase SppA [Clostridiales Family XIII bacterium]
MYDDEYENRIEPREDARPEAQERPAADARPEAQEQRAAAAPLGTAPRPDAAHGKSGLRGWRKGALIYVAVFVGIVLLGFAFRAMFFNPDEPSAGAPGSPYIARLNVIGDITGEPVVDLLGNLSGYYHEWTLMRRDDLIYDDDNYGLILFVDSPGGGVYESDALYRKLREYKDSTDRPVYAVMGSMAASGGYYVSAAADRIYANRNTWTGSIGVTMGTMVDLSGFLDRYGVRVETITAGRNKAMGSSFEPMTDEQRDIFQGLVDEAYDQFTGIVAEERALDLEYVRELADGRIYTATQAAEKGLIDDFGDVHTALGDMRDMYELFFCELAEFSYQNNSLLGRLLGVEAEKSLSSLLSRLSSLLAREGGDIGAVLRLAESHVPAPQYLYER